MLFETVILHFLRFCSFGRRITAQYLVDLNYGTAGLGHLHYPLTCANVTNMLTRRKKQNVIKNTARHDTDTGSPEVQVGLLTRKIEELASHLKKQPKDIHSRRGLLGMVADRRAHLKYLEKKNKRAYNALLKKLDLKK